MPPNSPNRPSPQGRISITIGKIAVESRAHKAQPCHGGGTEVTGRGDGGNVTARLGDCSKSRAALDGQPRAAVPTLRLSTFPVLSEVRLSVGVDGFLFAG